MRKVILSAVLIVAVALLGAVPSSAQSFDPDDVFISEIADADSDFNAEYLEIYNNSDSDIDLRAEGGKVVMVGSDGSVETVFDFNDNLDSGSATVPAKGFLIVPRGASEADFETEWGPLPSEVNYNDGNSTLYLGTGSQRQWQLWVGGTDNAADGTKVDDTNQVAGGSGDRSYQETPGNWVHGDDQANATPGELDSGQVLPVELATFTAQVSGTQAQLQWETLSETNNAGFDIQHKAPGASSFRTLGFVEGHGTTNTPQSYRFNTDALDAGTHTFRLRQIDLDGTDALHKPITVEVSQDNLMRLTGPNPVQSGGSTELTIQPEQSGDMTVALYNVLGQRVETLHSGAVAADDVLRLTLDTDRLSSGMYFVRANGDSVRQTERITVVR